MNTDIYQNFNLISIENSNFTIGKKGDRLLNYILQVSSTELILLSTYYKSKLKYCAKLTTQSIYYTYLLSNILKEFTWTIEPSKGIKTYKNNHPLSLREYLNEKLPNVCISVKSTPVELKDLITSIHKNSNKPY